MSKEKTRAEEIARDTGVKDGRRGKPIEECPDGPRYKAIGNGQTVTVMEWLARRIMAEMTR